MRNEERSHIDDGAFFVHFDGSFVTEQIPDLLTVCLQEDCEGRELDVEEEVAVSDALPSSEGTCLIGRRAMRLTWSSASDALLHSKGNGARTVHGFPSHEESVLCCMVTW